MQIVDSKVVLTQAEIETIQSSSEVKRLLFEWAEAMGNMHVDHAGDWGGAELWGLTCELLGVAGNGPDAEALVVAVTPTLVHVRPLVEPPFTTDENQCAEAIVWLFVGDHKFEYVLGPGACFDRICDYMRAHGANINQSLVDRQRDLFETRLYALDGDGWTILTDPIEDWVLLPGEKPIDDIAAAQHAEFNAMIADFWSLAR